MGGKHNVPMISEVVHFKLTNTKQPFNIYNAE